jgi:hypothetical protein
MPTDGEAVSKNGKTEPTKEKQTPAPTEGEKKEEDEKDAEADGDEDDSSNDSNGFDPTERCSFLAMAQRRSELLSKDVLHPLTHRVFGTPLLLRVVDLEGLTGREVYSKVAKHLRNVVPPAALTFLQGEDVTVEKNGRGSEGNDDGYTKVEIRQRLRKTMTDMEEVAAGPVPRYGFRLRLACRDGRRCALCPWYDCCIGCLVPDDDAATVVMNGDSIVIDWHFAVDVATNGFGTRSNQADQASSQQQSPFRAKLPGVSVKNHSSCGNGAKKKGHAGAITLEDCLDAFAKEEKIPEVSR